MDLKSLAESVFREFLLKQASDVIVEELMEDDPECALLSDKEWTIVSEMIANAKVDIRVVVH